MEDDWNFNFASGWLAKFGLKSPTSLEARDALMSIGRSHELLGNKAPTSKLEAFCLNIVSVHKQLAPYSNCMTNAELRHGAGRKEISTEP